MNSGAISQRWNKTWRRLYRFKNDSGKRLMPAALVKLPMGRTCSRAFTASNGQEHEDARCRQS
jgi:hypothetical protein